MIARWIFGFALTFFCLTTNLAVTYAANIRDTDNELCAFQLDGEIRAGDSRGFASMMKSHQSTIEINKDWTRIREWDERQTTVCLNSPGGSFVEGLAIAEMIYNNGLSTLVENGSKCFSSCAVIFMAGVIEQTAPYRKLSAGGILGFHAPFLQMPQKEYSKEDVENYSQGLREAIFGLVRLSAKRTVAEGVEFIRKSLIQRLLEAGPNDLAVVGTIFDAARWNIIVYDAQKNYSIPFNKVIGVKNMCENFLYSNLDQPVPANVNWSVKIDRYSGKGKEQYSRILVVDAHTQDTVCELYPTGGDAKTKQNPDGVAFRGCSFDYWSDRSFGDCREYKSRPPGVFGKYLPLYFALAPETPLKPFEAR